MSSPRTPVREDFDGAELPIAFQWLRSPWPDELFSLTARPGHLRLFGRETIGSAFRQSLVARRQQSHCFSAATVARLRAARTSSRWRGWCATTTRRSSTTSTSRTTRRVGRHLRVMSSLPDQVQADAFTPPIAIPDGRPMHLRVEVDFERLRFGYRVDGEDVAAGCRSSSTRASCRTKRPRPDGRISPVPSSAWRARISPARRCRPISTTSNTASARSVPP